MHTIREQLAACVQEHQSKPSYELSQKIKSLQAELGAAIAKGAKPCKLCNLQPFGLRHIRGTKRKDGEVVWHHIYEVGCLQCKDCKAFAETPQEAGGPELLKHDEAARSACVDKWNSLQLAKG